MAYLFRCDCLRQSLQLGLAGAWDYEHPGLLNMLVVLSKKCPNLVGSFMLFDDEKTAVARHDKSYIRAFGSTNNWSSVLKEFHIKYPYSVNFNMQLECAHSQLLHMMPVTVGDTDDIQLFPSIAFDD